ncbi:MAG: metal ABC transporter substrate-binding protein [Spirochaetota bacterium]
MRNRYLLALLIFAFVLAPAWAAGSAEASRDDRDTEAASDTAAHGGEEIPEIPQLVEAGERLIIVGTTTILGDVLANVAGDDADVTVLMPVGQNPHSFEPTPSTLRTLERADIVFVNGFGLEEALLGELDEVARGYVVPVSAGIEPLEHDDDDHGHDHGHEEGDSHVWMDPNNVMIWVENMMNVLASADPANAEAYRARGSAYLEELSELDREIRNRIESLTPEHRKLVLDHESLSYFADEYGLRTVGTIVPGTSDRAEPSAQDVARLVDVIREENVGAIFVGRTASRGLRRLADTIADEVGHEVAIVPTLSGSLADRGKPGDTYLGFVRYNVDQIMTGLRQ